MLKLAVTTPDKRKVELECLPSTTFAEVKSRIEAATGVPADKQRLLCNGRERRDGKETLAAAGVGAKSKLMLMLAPGYSMPAVDVPAAPQDLPQEAPEEAADVELEGDLPGDAAEQATVPMVVVRQGRNRYKVRVRQGLDKASFGELADYLVAQMLPPGIPACELRLISKGKTAAREDPLGAADGKELSVMLMFREGFHLAVEGDRWMQEKSEELSQAEAKIASLSKRVEANFSDAETSLQLAEVSGFVETLLQSVDSVRLNSTKLPAMQELRDRAVKAEERGYLSFAEVRACVQVASPGCTKHLGMRSHEPAASTLQLQQRRAPLCSASAFLLSSSDRLSGIDLRGTFDLDGTGMVSTAVLRRSLATFDPQVFSDECLDLLLRPSCANGERSVHILDVFGPFWQPFCHRLQQLQEKVAQTKRQAQKRQVQLAQTAQDTTEELRAQLEMARQSRRSGEAEPDRQMLELRGRLLECEQEKLRLEEQLAQGPTLLGGPAEVTALPKGKSFQTELGNTGLRRKRTAWREESDTTDLAQQLLKASEQNRKTLEAEVRKALGRLEQALSRSVYINHGGGPLPLLQKQPSISKFLASYAASLPRPSAVLVVTAHWETDALKVSAGKSHSLYFDYGGFPKAGFSLEFPSQSKARRLTSTRTQHLEAQNSQIASSLCWPIKA
ncbi:unnamed protein product [Effrenium voratum]|nr:unnamed protein product [Effrenium voratum]